MKKRWQYIVIICLILFGLWTYKFYIRSSNQTATIADTVSASPQLSETFTPEPTTDAKLCDNENEITHFDKPIPIIWTARLDGCLVSCYGASFTRVPSDKKYPRFAGYYPDTSDKYAWDNGGSQIPDEFLEDDLVLRIHGEWTSIDADHPRTVFENKCVSIVEIEKIEKIKK